MKKDLKWFKEKIRKSSMLADFQANDIMELIDEIEQPELPEIPEFVAEYIKHEQEAGLSLKESLNHLKNRSFQEIDFVGKTASYLDRNFDNFDKYVDAYRHGYVTVEEKKYYVMSGDIILLTRRCIDCEIEKVAYQPNKPNYLEEFTEQEIKDFDERYLAFTIPIEDIEEENR